MGTVHRVVFGNCRTMREINNESVQLMVTSPPYYNAPFDYPNLFKDYDEFLGLIDDLCRDLYRVLAPGRVACFVTDDMLVKGEKYPSQNRPLGQVLALGDRKSTRLNSSHSQISYAVFCLKKKNIEHA